MADVYSSFVCSSSGAELCSEEKRRERKELIFQSAKLQKRQGAESIECGKCAADRIYKEC